MQQQRNKKFLDIGKQKAFNIFSGEKDWIDKEKFLQKFKMFQYILKKNIFWFLLL